MQDKETDVSWTKRVINETKQQRNISRGCELAAVTSVASGLLQKTDNKIVKGSDNGKADFAECCSGLCIKFIGLFDKAIKVGWKQILHRYYYSLEFGNEVRSIQRMVRLKIERPRPQMYKEMKFSNEEKKTNHRSREQSILYDM